MKLVEVEDFNPNLRVFTVRRGADFHYLEANTYDEAYERYCAIGVLFDNGAFPIQAGVPWRDMSMTGWAIEESNYTSDSKIMLHLDNGSVYYFVGHPA